MGGGSEQGLLNPVVPASLWEIDAGSDPKLALLWLKAMAVDAMYTAGPQSEEPYKDIQRQERFAGLPLLFDDSQGTRIYATNRRYSVRARVVNTARLNALTTPGGNQDLTQLAPYVDLLESGPDAPPTLQRESTDAMVVRAKLESGQSLLIQETWDPVWRASVNGRSLAVRKDPMGFMVVDPPAGDQTIRLEFPMPVENQIGWAVTWLTLAVLAVLFLRKEV
jgi:hypothetical protein